MPQSGSQWSGAMSFLDIPALSVLRTKMQWHQQRQSILSQNVANSDTPNFRPRDLVAPKFDKSGAITGSMGQLVMATTSSGQDIAVSTAGTSFDQNKKVGFETRPAGNAVNLEEEMMKVASNQMDYAAATSLYSKSLGILKTALDRG